MRQKDSERLREGHLSFYDRKKDEEEEELLSLAGGVDVMDGVEATSTS